MQAQVAAAIDERLRAEGAKRLGDRLVAHANTQKAAWPPAFYNAYYSVLTGYLEEINYAGEQTPRQPPPPAVPADPSPINGRGAGTGVVSAVPAVIANGTATTAPVRTRKERLAELKELLDEGLITAEEFDGRRREILAEV